MTTRGLDRARGEIDRGYLRAAASKLQQVRAHAAADFQQLRSREFVEAHHLRHPGRVFLVTMTLNFLKELARAELVPAPIDSTGRVLVPLIARAVFIVGHELGN